MAQQSADLQTDAESQHDHSWRNAVLDGPFVDKTDLYRMPWTNHDNPIEVSGFSFITYRGLTILPGYRYGVDGSPVNVKKEDIGYATKEEQAAITVTSYDVLEKIREEVPEYDPCAYLGGTKSHQSVKWLLGQLVATDKTILGSVGKKTIELGQIVHHLTKGRYFIYSRGQYFPRMALFAGIFDPKVRKMWKRYLLNPTLFFKRLYGVGFGIVQAPDVLSDGSIDMCDSCPDMTVYEGQLINSCRMDEYRKYGGLLSPMHGEAEA